MSTDANQGNGLEARIARLEARIARIEAALTPIQPAEPDLPTRPPMAPPSPATASPLPASALPTPPPAVTPSPPPGPTTYWQAPSPRQATVPYGTASPAQASAPLTPTLPSLTPPEPRPFAVSLGELEERLAGRALAAVGGIALILGAIFFLSLAFSRGWIGPELRVLIGLAAGSAAVAAGAVFLERRNPLLGNVLTPVGLAIISISLVGATRLYHIVPTELGLLGAFLSAVIVAIVAVRNDSQLVAAFGLISVLLAPPLLGAGPDSTTLAFIGVVLVGTTSVALWRSWAWLPPIAFLLTVPQAASWIGSHPAPAMALVGIGAYWALNIVAAGGEEFRRHRNDLSSSSATLLLGNAAFAVWAGFVVLSGDLAVHRGLFLVGVAIAHLAVGGYFVARDGERNLFGLLTLGTGIAALTMAMPIQLGAPAVPVAWTAEAVALAWVAARRGHPYSAAISIILFLLAGAAVGWLYPIGAPDPAGTPFLDARGDALGFFLGGVGLGVWILRDRSLRSGLAALGILVAAYCAGTVLDGVRFVAAETALIVVAAATIRSLPRLPDEAIEWLTDGLLPKSGRALDWRPPLDALLPAAVFLTGFAVSNHLMAIELPLLQMGRVTPPAIPFSDAGAAAAAILAAGVLGAGWILGGAMACRIAIILAGFIVAYAIPYEVYAWAVAVLWAALALGSLVLARRDPAGRTPFEVAAGVAVIGSAIVTFGIVAPPIRLVVGSGGVPLIVTLQSAAALVAVIVGVVASGSASREAQLLRWSRLAAGVIAVYLLSVAVVDVVGNRIGGSVGLEELRTQGQVALSVLWTALGVVTFVVGLGRNVKDARQGGLALLALATAKVFLFDLAALDVAYRVISLIALGLLLLASAWLWQRAQPKVTANGEDAGEQSMAP
jgi:uncharacterized membrane protein